MSVDLVVRSKLAQVPKQATSGSVGCDLFSADNYILYRNKAILIDCALHMQIPTGYCGLISGRSSFALCGILTHVGIIYNDYCGTIGVILINVACFPTYEIKKGNRIGQITLLRFEKASFNEVLDFQMKNYGGKLRIGGFGSTGR